MGNPFTKFDKDVAEGNIDRKLSETIKYGQSSNGPLPVFYRYVVLEAIFDPFEILGSDNNKIDHWQHVLGVSNMEYAGVLPRNTVIAQRITDGSTSASDPPMFLFPFFPSHLALPCKPGEHIWVMFEAPGIKETSIGYWFCKITEIGHVDDVNHTHAPRAFEPSFVPGLKDVFDGAADAVYEFANGRREKYETGERYTVSESNLIPGGDEGAYEKLLTDPDGSQPMTYESIPRYRKRPGDMAFEGSNNTLLVLGTDRTGTAADLTKVDPNSGIKPAKPAPDLDGNAGMIDIVAGRGQTDDTAGKDVTSKRLDKSDFNKELDKSYSKLAPKEGDPDWKNDRSRVMIVQRTMVDKNLGTDKYNSSAYPDVKDPDKGCGAVIVKSDKVRIIARSDVEILVSGFTTDGKGNMVSGDDTGKFASIIIRASGDIIFKPADKGVIKLGGDDASLAVLCQKAATGAGDGSGAVSAPPIIDTMAGSQGGGGPNGEFARKVLLKLMASPIKDGDVDPGVKAEANGQPPPPGDAAAVAAGKAIPVYPLLFPPGKGCSLGLDHLGGIFNFDDIVGNSPPSPTKKVLTHVKLLDANGKISDSGKNRFISEVIALVAAGNMDGKGVGIVDPAWGVLAVPMPPVPAGIKLPNPTTLKFEDLLWFDPDPLLAGIYAATLPDKAKTPIWHTIFIDTLYEGVANALNLNGSTPALPIADWSFVAPGFDPNLSLACLALKLNLPSYKFILKLPSIGIPIPPIPPLPIPLPIKLPTIPFPLIPPEIKFTLPKIFFDFIFGIPKIAFDLFLKLPPFPIPPKLPDIILKLVIPIFELFLKLPIFEALVPKLFIASILILIKNIVGMLLCDIIGMLLGTGTICSAAAVAVGLV